MLILKLLFFLSQRVIERDEKIIASFKGKKDIAKSLALSRYKCKKLYESSATEMLDLIRKIGPPLVECGALSLQLDHKFVKSGIANFQDKLFAVNLVIKFNRQSAYYPLCLHPADTSGTEEATDIAYNVLTVSQHQKCKYKHFRGIWSHFRRT
jgi:hypothetical protein